MKSEILASVFVVLTGCGFDTAGWSGAEPSDLATVNVTYSADAGLAPAPSREEGVSLTSDQNYMMVKANGCAPIDGAAVRINFDVDTPIPPEGFSVQLNASSLTNAANMVWQQYVIGVSGRELYAKVENWVPDGPKLGIINSFYGLTPDLGNQNNSTNYIAAGASLVIQLNTDDEHNVIGATYTYNPPGGTPSAVKMDLREAGTVTEPIVSYTVNIVGPCNDQNVDLMGKGRISYFASTQIEPQSWVPPCTQNGRWTAETSNVNYGELPAIQGTAFVQTFSAFTE